MIEKIPENVADRKRKRRTSPKYTHKAKGLAAPLPKPKRDKAGCPPVEIDLEMVKNFSRFQLSDYELASMLGISSKTLYTHKKKNPKIAQAMEEGKQLGFASIKAKRFQVAVAGRGNVPMLKYLSMVWFDEKDKLLVGSDPENPLPAHPPMQYIPLSEENIKKIADTIRNEY